MVSERTTIILDIDAMAARLALDDLDNQLDAFMSKEKAARKVLKRGIQQGLRLIQNMMTAYRLVARIVGRSITPMEQQVMAVMSATVSMMIAWQAAMGAQAPLNPVALFSLGLSAVAMGVVLGETTKMTIELNNAKDAQQKMEEMLGGLPDIRGIISGLGGA